MIREHKLFASNLMILFIAIYLFSYINNLINNLTHYSFKLISWDILACLIIFMLLMLNNLYYLFQVYWENKEKTKQQQSLNNPKT